MTEVTQNALIPWNSGKMECWFLFIIPIFQYSIIPNLLWKTSSCV